MANEDWQRTTAGAVPARSAFAGPRLELPRFRLTTAVADPTPERDPQRTPYAPPARPWRELQPVVQAPAMPAPAPSTVPAPMRPVPQPAHAMAATATVPRPTTISWDRLEPATPELTLLQRITPVHMGVLLVLVVAVMVMTSGPGAMNAAAPVSLPATVSGGGTGPVDGVIPPTNVRAGSVATSAAATAAPPAAKVLPKVATPRALRVGSATVDADVRHGGIPSPAAGALLAGGTGGGATIDPDAPLRLAGIPSPAAAALLGPQTLPMRPSDGVTLPRTVGERDGYGADRHYGNTGTLALAAPVEQPALTPGAAAAQAERMATQHDLTGTLGTPPAGQVGAF